MGTEDFIKRNCKSILNEDSAILHDWPHKNIEFLSSYIDIIWQYNFFKCCVNSLVNTVCNFPVLMKEH